MYLKLRKHLQQNFNFYLLAMFFSWLGYFDVGQQNLFLTANFRLPFFVLTMLGLLVAIYYPYSQADLCATQSSNYRKLALTTLGYFVIAITSFYLIRDPAKAQLFVYCLGILLSLSIYLNSDKRLGAKQQLNQIISEQEESLQHYRASSKTESSASENDQVAQAETNLNNIINSTKTSFTRLVVPALGLATLLQLFFYSHVAFKYFIFFNPFLQFALALNLANFAFTLVSTRLDVLKLYYTIIETLLLLGAGIFFIIVYYFSDAFATEYSLHLTDQALTFTNSFNFQACIVFAVGVIALSVVNLLATLTKSYKGYVASLMRAASLLFYFGLFTVSKGVFNI